MNDPYSEEAGKRFDWGEFIHASYFRVRKLVLRYWWVLLICISAGVTIQAYRHLNEEPVYRSTARLMVRGQINIPEHNIYQEEFMRFYNTQIDLMQSPRIRSDAYQRMAALHPGLPRQPVQLRATVSPDTSIFIMQATSPDPVYTQRYLDAAVSAYINFRREMRSQTSEEAYLSITEQLLNLEEEIERQELVVVDFKRQNNVTFIQERVRSIGDRLVRLNNTLADLQSEFRLLSTLPLEQQLEGAVNLERADTTAERSVNTIALISGNPDFIEAKQTLNKLEVELREFSRVLRPRHPKIIQLRLDIESMHHRLNSIREQSAGRLEDAKQVLEIRIADKRQEIRDLEREALAYQQRLAEFQQTSSRLDLLKANYSRLQERLSQVEVNTNLDQERIGILDAATPAVELSGNMVKSILEGVVGGLLAGGGIIFLIALIDNRVRSIDDLNNHFEEPVVGAIPFEPSLERSRQPVLLQEDDERHTFAEACRNLRSSILLMDKDLSQSQIVLVTSAVPGEGKSTIAANLAIALSFAKFRVLLVDADLRRGHLARSLGLERAPGLAEMVQGEAHFQEVVQPSALAGLDFISTGQFPDRPGELLLDRKMQEFLNQSREHYDFVVIDSAPVLATDDTTSFVNRVDRILFTIRSDYSRIRQIRPAMERLKMRNAQITGLVLNFINAREPNYYYYKYSEYYNRPRSEQSGGKRKRAESAVPS